MHAADVTDEGATEQKKDVKIPGIKKLQVASVAIRKESIKVRLIHFLIVLS